MVLRENNCGVRDTFCEYTVLGAQSLCNFFVSLTISALWGTDRQHLALTYLSSLYPQLVSASFSASRSSLFHHSDRTSL